MTGAWDHSQFGVRYSGVEFVGDPDEELALECCRANVVGHSSEQVHKLRGWVTGNSNSVRAGSKSDSASISRTLPGTTEVVRHDCPGPHRG